MMRYLIVLLMVFCLSSCSHKRKKADLKKQNHSNIQAVETKLEEYDKGDYNQKTLEDIHYAAVKIDPAKMKELSKARLDENDLDYSAFTCVLFYITMKDQPDIVSCSVASFHQLNDKIQYLSFDIRHDFSLESGGQRYACINSSFERSFGNIPYARFFLVFDKAPSENFTVSFNDRYFNNGIINFNL